MKASRLRIAALVAVIVAPLLAAGAPARVSAEAIVIRLAHTLPADHPVGKGAIRFKELVEERTHGAVTVQIYPYNQLGGENQLLQQEKQNSIQMALTGAGTLGNLVPQISVLEAPYLWKDFASEKKVLNGPIFAGLQRATMDTQGLRIVSGTWYYGLRNLTANKAVNKPEDAAGMKIRTPPSPVNLLSGRVLGGAPTPMDFPQVYLALKTGTIDGQENPLSLILAAKLFEVNKYIMLTRHIQQSQILTINQKFLAGLPREYQQVIVAAANEAGDYETQLAQTAESEDLKKLRAIPGVTIVEPDLAPFRARAHQMVGEMASKWGNLYERIEAAQK